MTRMLRAFAAFAWYIIASTVGEWEGRVGVGLGMGGKRGGMLSGGVTGDWGMVGNFGCFLAADFFAVWWT